MYFVCVFVFSLQVLYKLPEVEETSCLQAQPPYYLDEPLMPRKGELFEEQSLLSTGWMRSQAASLVFINLYKSTLPLSVNSSMPEV